MRSTMLGAMSGAALLALGCAASTPVAALDYCDRVRELHEAGKDPAAIARELAITTPDVQACLADEVRAPVTGRESGGRIPLGPTLSEEAAPVPREPNQ